MKSHLAAGLALALFSLPAGAQDIDSGADLYLRHCAMCHGIEARGGGPMTTVLVIQPPNLRQLTARNDGTFPITRVVTRIDGRDPLVSHGSAMPVYGDFFDGDDTAIKAETGQPIMTSRPIVDLLAYLRSIQD